VEKQLDLRSHLLTFLEVAFGICLFVIVTAQTLPPLQMSGACTVDNTGLMSCPLAGNLIPPAADIGAQINASVAAHGVGKYVLLPGHYNSSTTINPNVAVTLECAGAGTVTFGSNMGTCLIDVAVGVDGFKCGINANGSSIRGISFYSLNTAVGTNNGVNVGCQFFSATDIVVQKFGNDGLHFDSGATGAGQANHWNIRHIQSMYNFRDGVHWAGTDVNAGEAVGVSVAGNGRNGFDDTEGGLSNTIIGAIANGDTNLDYNLEKYNVWITPYCEGTGAMHLNGAGNVVISVLFGQCTITETTPGSNFLYGSH
jgi:hypothetical protein